MKNEKGFTLIELVVVIVILGILAVTAAPKFLNLQDDSREAALKGLAAAVSSASTMVYAKAVIKGVENEPTAQIDINGVQYDLVYGNIDRDQFLNVLNTDATMSMTIGGGSMSGGWIKFEGAARPGENTRDCAVYYQYFKNRVNQATVEIKPC